MAAMDIASFLLIPWPSHLLRHCRSCFTLTDPFRGLAEEGYMEAEGQERRGERGEESRRGEGKGGEAKK